MIKFENITKCFADNVILDNVSGEFFDGKINMIIGRSGTGKSVLFKCILGLINVDSGKIFFDDKEMVYSEDVKNNEFKEGIGMLPQNPTLFPEKTVAENVQFPLDILTNFRDDEKKKLVSDSLTQVGLRGREDQYPHDLSGGLQKKVSLARAIVHKPKYLFCDEPDSGLDPTSSKEIDLLIHKISKEYNMTTVIVTHNLDSVIGIGEHILFLYESKKLWEGNVKDIYSVNVPEFDDFLSSSKLFQKYKRSIINKLEKF